jgi:hypothetical protein
MDDGIRHKPRTSPRVLILLVAIFTVLALVVGFQLTQHLPTAGTPTKSTGEVSLSMYTQIQPGMGYAEMYSWTNSDGSNMNVMLQNDRVVSKAQFGLK